MAEAVSGSYAQSPGTSTLSQLKSEVCRYVKAPNDTDALAVAHDGIKEAIRRINMRSWQWMLTSDDITLTAGTADYTMQSTFKAPRSAELLDSSDRTVGFLSYEDPKNFDLLHPDRDTSSWSTHYTIRNIKETGQVTLAPTPDASFVSSYPTVRFRYYKFVSLPSAEDDRIGVPVWIEPVVSWWAKMYVAIMYQPELAQFAKNIFYETWQAAVAEDREQEATDFDTSNAYV